VGKERELEGWSGRCFDRAAYRLHFSSLSSPLLICTLRVCARVLVNNFYSHFDLWPRVIDIAAEVPMTFVRLDESAIFYKPVEYRQMLRRETTKYSTIAFNIQST